MTYPTNVLIGDRVRYQTDTGIRRGEVVKIMEDHKPGEKTRWIYVQYHNEKSPSKQSVARITEEIFKISDGEVIFRDSLVG